jgi:hypothetical protein
MAEKEKPDLDDSCKEQIDSMKKGLLGADETGFKEGVVDWIGELMGSAFLSIEWNAEQRDILIKGIAEANRNIQEDFKTVQADMAEAARRIYDIEQAFVVYVIQDLERWHGRKLTHKKRKAIASLVNREWTKKNNALLNTHRVEGLCLEGG